MKTPRSKSTDLIEYLISQRNKGESNRIPTIPEISEDLGISRSTIREQLEVAKALGFVEARTKTGIRLNPYRLKPAIIKSLDYGINTDAKLFDEFSNLRKHLEVAYWDEAVSNLTSQDVTRLQQLIDLATSKLESRPIIVPHEEHKELHMTIFRRVGNPLVTDLLESYWDLYERSGFNVLQDLAYLTRVWNYHKSMVGEILKGNNYQGKILLMDHFDLIQELKRIDRKSYFE